MCKPACYIIYNWLSQVEEATMLMDNQTKRHRGFGFVTFDSEDVVEDVCNTHYHHIKNKKVNHLDIQLFSIVMLIPPGDSEWIISVGEYVNN